MYPLNVPIQSEAVGEVLSRFASSPLASFVREKPLGSWVQGASKAVKISHIWADNDRYLVSTPPYASVIKLSMNLFISAIILQYYILINLRLLLVLRILCMNIFSLSV